MQIYEVRISHGARADMAELRKFLKSMMTVEGAISDTPRGTPDGIS